MTSTGGNSPRRVVLLLSLADHGITPIGDAYTTLAVDQAYYITDVWHSFATKESFDKDIRA
eukprot:12881048-Prorocentrum_lima.AAC.1